jgi:hypothetical protein
MSDDPKSWEQFNKLNESTLAMSAMYAAVESKLKPRGTNLTPPKKKRKKK